MLGAKMTNFQKVMSMLPKVAGAVFAMAEPAST
jgi:hypothetical protein